MTIEQIAKVAHEINRTYCTAIGDTTQLAWEAAPEWQRKSAINGVNFHLATPGAKPDTSHNAWLAEKLADGWQYGPTKDAANKLHPCCVSYDKLPTEQRAKDYLFSAVVEQLKNFIV